MDCFGTCFTHVQTCNVTRVHTATERTAKRKTKPTVKSRSKGNKANPTCQLCGKVGHYSSTCPALASKLFNAVKKTAGTAAIRKLLASNVSVRVQGLEKKPLRTLKRARGKRAKTLAWKHAKKTVGEKGTRKSAPKRKHAQKDKSRRPKAMKTLQSKKRWPGKRPLLLIGSFYAANGLGSRRPAAVGNHFSMCRGVHVNNVALAGCFCKILGIGGAQGSAAQRLGKFLLSAEASCAEKQQQNRKLQGLIECDGTSIRFWKVPKTTNLCYWQLFGACERGRRVVNLYDLSLAISRNFGKPPPESYSRIASTSFFEDVSYQTDSGQRTCLISDGAPCYDKIASCTGLLKRSVNHSKGEFERKERLHNKVISFLRQCMENAEGTHSKQCQQQKRRTPQCCDHEVLSSMAMEVWKCLMPWLVQDHSKKVPKLDLTKSATKM